MVLHCNGGMAEMKAVAEGTAPLGGERRRRAPPRPWCASAQTPEPFDVEEARRAVRRRPGRSVGGVSEAFQLPIEFEVATEAADDGDALIVDLDGYEGPLHVLLALARSQKVDLLKLSVTRLADQYLAFVREARTRRFALAADYLVMAAWLAYLKSRLLLPKPERLIDADCPAEAVAARLAFRLAKLGAMRDAAQALKGRPILKRDVFGRGDPEAIRIVSHTRLEGDLYGLMTAYIGQKNASG